MIKPPFFQKRYKSHWDKILITILVLVGMGLLIGLGGILYFIGVYKYYSQNLPSDLTVSADLFPQTTRIFSRNGHLLYRYIPGEERYYVKLEDMPQHLIDAFLAVEDHRFFEHQGISFIGLARAMLTNIKTGKLVEGGSTITQQLARILFLNSEASIERKIKEIILALRLENLYSKQDILELYLNKISFGSNIYGVEAAAQEFFGKHASQLNLAESAVLAAMPKAPSQFFPQWNKHQVLQRQKVVLTLMQKRGFISDLESLKAKRKKLAFKEEKQGQIKAPHFVFYVVRKLRDHFRTQDLASGFDVTTTLNLDLQKKAEEILKNTIASYKHKYHISNAALVALDAHTGDILAMVGSYNFWEPEYGQFNAALAKRQPGSTLKPFIYALAFDKFNLTKESILKDTYTKIGSYVPRNFDRKYHGPVSAQTALVYSYNVPAVRLLDRLGVKFVRDRMAACGLNLSADAGLSLAIGGAATTLLDLTQGYLTFPNKGQCVKASPFLQVKNRTTSQVYHLRGQKKDIFGNKIQQSKRIFSAPAAREVTSILKETKTSYSNLANLAGMPAFKGVALKTGTSDGPRDVWTIGYNDDIILGLWMGNNDDSLLRQDVYALKVAVPVWAEVMAVAMKR